MVSIVDEIDYQQINMSSSYVRHDIEIDFNSYKYICDLGWVNEENIITEFVVLWF